MLNRAPRILRGRRSSHHDPDDGGGHQVGHGAGEHGANAEAGEVGFFIRGEGADAADLNTDGAEVGEAAEREGSDGEGARIERVLHGAKALEGDQFVGDHAQAQQVSDGMAVVPGNSDDPGDGREEIAENLFDAGGKPHDAEMREAVVHRGEDAVHEINQRDESDEHGADVEGEAETVHGAAGERAEGVGVAFQRREFHFAGGYGHFGFGDHHFGKQDCAGGGHDHGGEDMFGFDTVGDVGGHHAAGNVRHTAGHDGHQFRLRHFGQIGANGEGRLGLAHEDAGSDVERFGAAGAHEAGHDARGLFDDELHHAVVIKHGEDGGDKNDSGQDLEGEEEAHGRAFFSEVAEDELGAEEGEIEDPVYGGASLLEYPLAVGPIDDEIGEDDLQAEAPGDGFPADGAAIGGE